MPTQVANEKWILTVKELHLGHCKETFRAGAVIELDEPNGRLIIDGRRFNDTRDLDVLKRQAEKYPDNPWVVPYSKEMRAEVSAAFTPRAKVDPNRKVLARDQKLQIIQSDEDLNEEIDISSTKISKVNAAAKEASRNRIKSNTMEIIRGDESVEERIASLNGKNDMGSIAERARLKATGSAKMPVVRDDSLGAGFTGKSAVSLNAGQHLPSREEAESRTEDARARADSYKREADMKRKAAGIDGGEAPEAAVEAAGESAEVTTLRAENAALKEQMNRIEMMMAGKQAAAPKRGRKPKAVQEAE